MKPIIFLDLETTGTDIVQDRIVQLAAVKTFPDNTAQDIAKNILVNPGRPISKEASDVHKITDEMVKDKPMFAKYAKGIYEFMVDCDYGGFNIVDFDIPLLSEEFARCGIDWPSQDALFFDAFRVFREKERRDLSSAVKFYCKESHDNAHDALADVYAARKVVMSQMAMYEDISTPDKYAAFCQTPGALDLAGKIVLNDKGEAVYGFGKDKGKSVRQNPGFGKWMLDQSFSKNTKNIVKALINT